MRLFEYCFGISFRLFDYEHVPISKEMKERVVIHNSENNILFGGKN